MLIVDFFGVKLFLLGNLEELKSICEICVFKSYYRLFKDQITIFVIRIPTVTSVVPRLMASLYAVVNLGNKTPELLFLEIISSVDFMFGLGVLIPTCANTIFKEKIAIADNNCFFIRQIFKWFRIWIVYIIKYYDKSKVNKFFQSLCDSIYIVKFVTLFCKIS